MKFTCFAFLLFAAVAVHGGEAVLTFEKDIRPIVKAHCTHCHGEEEKPEGGLDLRLRRFMDKVLKGGEQVLVPGQPEKSELVQVSVVVTTSANRRLTNCWSRWTDSIRTRASSSSRLLTGQTFWTLRCSDQVVSTGRSL